MIKKLLTVGLLALALAACRMPPEEKIADDTVKLTPSSLTFEVNQTRAITVTKGAGVTDFTATSSNPLVTVTRDGDTLSVTATQEATANIVVKANTNSQVVATVTVTPDNRITITPSVDTIVGAGLQKTFEIFKGASIGALNAKTSDDKAVAVVLSGTTLTVTGVKIGESAQVWVQDDNGKQTAPITISVKDLLLTTQDGSTSVSIASSPQSIDMTVTKGKDIGEVSIIGGGDFLSAEKVSDNGVEVKFTITGKKVSNDLYIELRAYSASTNTTSPDAYGVKVIP